ncbi:MAG: hypothetical protein JO283_05240, partial [Bradyrhizobium sp.]|nr:hypothetical protein [Bradyrhizobium sp.]
MNGYVLDGNAHPVPNLLVEVCQSGGCYRRRNDTYIAPIDEPRPMWLATIILPTAGQGHRPAMAT